MSILTVQTFHMDSVIEQFLGMFSFRLLPGGMSVNQNNGEGKSTFMNIITGSLQPDEGKISGQRMYVLVILISILYQKGMTIENVLASAFDYLYDMESRITDLYMSMADVDEETMNSYMEELAHFRNS